MADETPEVPTPPETPPADPPQGDPPAEPTVDELRAQLEEERHARKLYEETLSALERSRGSATAASSPAGPPASGGAADPYIADTGITRSGIERIKAMAGLDSDDAALAWIKIVRPVMEELARPLVGIIGQTVDVMDRHEARLTVENYAEYAEEVEAEVMKLRAKGSHLPRAELVQLARAKRLPAMLKKQADEKKAAKEEARAARGAQAIETSTQKVGPTAGGRAPSRSVDEVKGLPTREERIKALEEMAGNRTF